VWFNFYLAAYMLEVTVSRWIFTSRRGFFGGIASMLVDGKAFPAATRWQAELAPPRLWAIWLDAEGLLGGRFLASDLTGDLPSSCA